MKGRKVVIDKSGNVTWESDDDCRLNFNFRASKFITRTLLVCSDKLAELANERKVLALKLVEVSKSTKAEAKRISPWLYAASLEARRAKTRRADKSKAPADLDIGRETCSVRSCYAFEYRDSLCEQHYVKRGVSK